jgi:hypothetical protein
MGAREPRAGEGVPLIGSYGSNTRVGKQISELSDTYSIGRNHVSTEVVQGYHGKIVTKYDANKLSTVMLLFMYRGTVFTNYLLWAETLFTLIVYGISFAVFDGVFLNDSSEAAARGMMDGVNQTMNDMNQTNSTNALGVARVMTGFVGVKGVESFVTRMSVLTAFLTSFYTLQTIARWWNIRTAGIGATWGACREISFWLPEVVTRDQEVLSNIRRYARASLALSFLMASETDVKAKLKQVTHWGLLTREETNKIQAAGGGYARIPWLWIANIIERLAQNGCIKSHNVFSRLQCQVEEGRKGLEVIGTHASVLIPLPYVHLLGVLVKTHNMLLALLYGYMVAACDCQYIFNTLKVILIPFLYNALLVTNAELADPFEGKVNEFPLKVYQGMMEIEGKAMYDAGANRPKWMYSNPNLKMAQ